MRIPEKAVKFGKDSSEILRKLWENSAQNSGRPGIGKGLTLRGTPRSQGSSACLWGRKKARGWTRVSTRERTAPSPVPALPHPCRGGGRRATSLLGWSFRGAAVLRVREYNPIFPFAPRESFFNYLSLSPFVRVISFWGLGSNL